MPSIPGTRAYDYWPAIPILRRRSYSKPDNFAGARMRTHRRVATRESIQLGRQAIDKSGSR